MSAPLPPAPDEVRRLAADIVVKCYVRGSIGGAYCPVETARRAFPSTDHPLFHDALAYLDECGFVQWHKGKTCFGLDPHAMAGAVSFALVWASPKRASNLMLRTRRGMRTDIGTEEREVAITESDDDESEEPDYVTHEALRRQVESLKALVLGRSSTDPSFASAIAEMRHDIVALKDEVGKLRHIYITEEKLRVIEKRVDNMVTETTNTLARMEEFVAYIEEIKRNHMIRKEAEGYACQYPDCDNPAVKMVPLWVSNGVNWKPSEKGGICLKHQAVCAGYKVSRRDIANTKRLVTKMPYRKTDGEPIVFGDRAAAIALMREMTDRGLIDRTVEARQAYREPFAGDDE